MFDRKGFELNIADSHWLARDHRLAIADGIALQPTPPLCRRIERAWSSPFQTTSVIEMGVSEDDGLRAQSLESAEPIHTAVH